MVEMPVRAGIIQSPLAATITIDGTEYANFGGSSYLGLSGKPEILEAGREALEQNGAGYQFARTYGIATPHHLAAEDAAASFFGAEAAMFLAGGYFFGLVALASFRDTPTAIFYDRLAHFTLREGIAASGLKHVAFRHLDAGDLADQIRDHLGAAELPVVVTDAIYSSLGEIAPLDEYLAVIRPYGGRLIVDESHAFGVLGARGRGACEHHAIPHCDYVMGGSTAKGLGVTGGIIVGTATEVARYRETPAGRGASSGLAASAAMCAASLRHVGEHPELLSALRDNTRYLKAALRSIGLACGDSVVPVAAFSSGNQRSMARLQQELFRRGIYVLHSNYIGSGPEGIIRCGIFADHHRRQLDALVGALRELL